MDVISLLSDDNNNSDGEDARAADAVHVPAASAQGRARRQPVSRERLIRQRVDDGRQDDRRGAVPHPRDDYIELSGDSSDSSDDDAEHRAVPPPHDFIDLSGDNSNDGDETTAVPPPHQEPPQQILHILGVNNIAQNIIQQYFNLYAIAQQPTNTQPTWFQNLAQDPESILQNDVVRRTCRESPEFMQIVNLRNTHPRVMEDNTHVSGGRLVHSPDGFLPRLECGKTLGILSFVPNTRLVSGHTTDNANLGQRHIVDEMSTGFVYEVATRVTMEYGFDRPTASVLSHGSIVLANRMPLSGRFNWQNDYPGHFNGVARVTDPLQVPVLQHILQRCENIDAIIRFGRPTETRLGSLEWTDSISQDRNFHDFQDEDILYHPCTAFMGWMTKEAQIAWVMCFSRTIAHHLGREVIDFSEDRASLQRLLPRRSDFPTLPSNGIVTTVRNAVGQNVFLSPEVQAILMEHQELRQGSTGYQREGSRRSIESAIRNGTQDNTGEFGCNKCGRIQLVRLNGCCGSCNGRFTQCTTASGTSFRALAYARASNCVDCVGPIGGRCKCRCSGVPTNAGTFVIGIDPNNYLPANPPRTIMIQVMDENGVSQDPGSIMGHFNMAEHIRPKLVELSQTVAGRDYLRANLPYALNLHAVWASFVKQVNELAVGIKAELLANPNRAIVVDGLYYRMCPWDFQRGER